MADTGNITQYVGRRFDLLAFRGAARDGVQLLTQSLFDTESSGQVITGIYKLAQRFLLEFLTEKGSLQYAPERGTEFMTKLRQGFLQSDQDVVIEFNFALVDITQNLVSEEESFGTMPDEERFDKAELLNFTILSDLLQLRVQVTSLAGTSREVILPISTLPVDTAVV